MTKLVFTVTNDLAYDQRMGRICSSLARAGYEVVIIGRKGRDSRSLVMRGYRQTRLSMFFSKGKLFYIEFNIRLFFKLLFTRCDAICAIDLDTILPVYLVARLKGWKKVYDAHELFCEMKEVVSRPGIYRFWKKIERMTVPRFKHGYTVNEPIRDEFRSMYGVEYEVIRNVPFSYPLVVLQGKKPFILYQGAVNEARCFETLIPAMKMVEAELIICGDGNFMQEARELVQQHGLENKVIFKGQLLPEDLRQITIHAYIGVTIFENKGKNNYYSLANRFFDYIAAGIPQICVNYPVYAEINKQFEVALLLDNTEVQTIASSLNKLLNDSVYYNRLQQNCLKAREVFNWENEEKKLLKFYKDLCR